MDKNLQNIEDLFRDGLEGNEELPSPKLWNDIDNILDKDNLASITKKYSNLKKVATILFLLLSGLAIYQLKFRPTNETLAKVNTDGSNTATVHNTDQRTFLPNTQFQKPLDSININKIQVEPNNNNTSSTASNQNESYKQNANVDDTINKKNIPANKSMQDSKYNPVIKNDLNSHNNAGQNNIVASKNKKGTGTNTSYKLKIKNPGVVEDSRQTTVNYTAESTDQAPRILKRLNSEGIDKINWYPQDSVGLQKQLQPIVINKVDLPVDEKNGRAANTKYNGNKPSRFSLTAFYSPDIPWYSLQDDKPGNHSDNSAEIEESEKHKFSSTFGILADYELSKYWSLQSGLTYSNTNITVEPQTVYAQPDNGGSIKYRINTSSGYGYVLPSFSSNPAIGDSLNTFTTTHSLNYINIPLAIKYTITEKKFSFNGMAGFSANFLTKGKIETTLVHGYDNETERVDKLNGLKNIYFSGLIGVGVDYKINNKMAFSLAPTLRFALNSINKDAPVKSYPNTVGFVFGLKIGI